MIAREASPHVQLEEAHAAVRAWLVRIEAAAERREPLRGALLEEYARRMSRYRWAKARMPRAPP